MQHPSRFPEPRAVPVALQRLRFGSAFAEAVLVFVLVASIFALLYAIGADAGWGVRTVAAL